MVEVDIRQTVDGVLVLAHDPEIEGVEIATTTWDRLSELRIEDQHPIPRLDEIRATFPDGRFDLEIKNLPGLPGFDEQLGSQVAHVAMSGDVITSFYWPDIDAIRTDRDDVATGLLLDDSLTIDEACAHASTNGHQMIAPRWDLLTDQAVGKAHGLDLGVIAWTVNDIGVARRLAEWGVDVIVTDDPGSIVLALEA